MNLVFEKINTEFSSSFLKSCMVEGARITTGEHEDALQLLGS